MNTPPKILLHICCAPCSTYPISFLSVSYSVSGLFFNPNLFPQDELVFRHSEVAAYLKRINTPLHLCDQPHNDWLMLTKELSKEPEGKQRCSRCFEFRLDRTAEYAVQNGFSVFTSTLTIGPNKPASIIFPIGRRVAEKHGITFLDIDFKKKDGYKKSCELSREERMYRQDYCGCEFSLRDRRAAIQKHTPPD